MLKSAIIATISIASLLSIANITDAKPISKKSTQQSISQQKPDLIAKKPKLVNTNNAAIPPADLQGIRQAVFEYFGELNDRQNPTIDQDVRDYKMRGNSSNSTGSKHSSRFIEIKSLKLTSFSTDSYMPRAELEVEIDAQEYDAVRIIPDPKAWVFKKHYKASGHVRGKTMRIEKFRGKWRVGSLESAGATYKDY
jgi:hypothetical protein